MELRGSSAYDQQDFLSKYIRRRERQDSPNNAIEGPVMDELIGEFRDKTVLELGCGNASFGVELLQRGAKSYRGIDGSEKMVEAAKSNLLKQNGDVYCETMESYDYPTNEFDIVTSRFAIHYVSHINELFHKVYKTLKQDGKFVFSVQHPLTTSSFISKQAGDKRSNWIVDDYFNDGERKEPWIDKVVVKYHRTIEQYFTALRQAGFTILQLREGTPIREHFHNEEEFLRRKRIPVVLAFSCVKES